MINQYIKKFFNKNHSSANQQSSNVGIPVDFHSKDVCTKKSSCYKKNVIVYRCVNLISQAVSHVNLGIYRTSRGQYIKDSSHHANFLLRKPNNIQSGFEFFNQVISQKLLFGNAYILSISPKSILKPSELYTLHPDCISIIVENGFPVGYKYKTNEFEKLYSIDQWSQKSSILHLKNFNPDNDVYGVSCVEASSRAIELHDRSTEWNGALLKNGARPTGALIMKDENRFLTEEQFERLRSQLNEKYQGAVNAGKPLLLEGGIDWKEMSISPKDMDFIESKNTAAREIALSFGVPPQLLGIKGDNTYSNMQEARIGLWEETIIPILDELTESLTNWFKCIYEDDIVVKFEKDSISILSEKQQNLWSHLSNASFMTLNEKRKIAGFDEVNTKTNSI